MTDTGAASYNAADTPSPRDLPQIGTDISAGLATLRSCQALLAGNVTADQARHAVTTCDAIVAGNRMRAILLRGWLRLNRFRGRQAARAARLLAQIKEADAIAGKVIAAMRQRCPVPTERARLVFAIPLRDVTFVSASLEFQIENTGSDLKILAEIERAAPHMLPARDIRELADDFDRALEVVAAIDDQIRRWRLQPLTAVQQVMIATLADQTASLAPVLSDGHRRCMLLVERITAAKAATTVTALIADLVHDE